MEKVKNDYDNIIVGVKKWRIIQNHVQIVAF